MPILRVNPRAETGFYRGSLVPLPPTLDFSTIRDDICIGVRKMKKAVFLLSVIIISASCFLFPRLDISGDWSGTVSYKQGGTYKLTLSLIQSGDTVTGTWSSSSGAGGSATGTISGHSIQGTLSGSYGYKATINGTISDSDSQITGSGTDTTKGAFNFSLSRR